MVATILLYFALVFAFLGAFSVPNPPIAGLAINWGWLAIAFWLLSIILGGGGLK